MYLPNVKKLFLPDPGNLICDVDLEQADVRAMAWDADAPGLKEIFRDPTKQLHMENAKTIYGPGVTSKSDPRYKKTKAGVHATDYGCRPARLAKVLGCSKQEAEKFQRTWFTAHPEIETWQKRIDRELTDAYRAGRMPFIKNPFGFWMPYFDRPDSILPQALAWGPQSVVAQVINQGLINLSLLAGYTFPNQAPRFEYKQPAKIFPELQLNLQVHDSLVFQYPVELDAEIRPIIHQALQIDIPYSETLVIPLQFKASLHSYGHCEGRDWDDFTPFI